jgi:hypothetical protein
MAMIKQKQWMGFDINAYAKISKSSTSDYKNADGEKRHSASIEISTYTDESKQYQIDFAVFQFNDIKSEDLNFETMCQMVYEYLLRNQFLGWDSDEDGGLKYTDILAENPPLEPILENDQEVPVVEPVEPVEEV